MKIKSAEKLQAENKAMRNSFSAIIDALEMAVIAINDYAEYEHSGDPYEEDSRAMGEMEIDDMKNDGRLFLINEVLKRAKEEL